MRKSYVGIADREGLETFLLEHEGDAEALAAAPRRGRARVCYWAVLQDTAAAEVHHLLTQGDRRGALVALDRAAEELGRLVPWR
jgi:hypothetical protein